MAQEFYNVKHEPVPQQLIEQHKNNRGLNLTRNVEQVVSIILKYLKDNSEIAHTARGISVACNLNVLTVSKALRLIQSVQKEFNENYKLTVKDLNELKVEGNTSSRYYYSKQVMFVEKRNE